MIHASSQICNYFHLFTYLSDPLYTLSSEDHSKSNVHVQLVDDKVVGVGQR